ncbi:hypothetical protein D3C80_1749310 [compost metagenome]
MTLDLRLCSADLSILDLQRAPLLKCKVQELANGVELVVPLELAEFGHGKRAVPVKRGRIHFTNQNRRCDRPPGSTLELRAVVLAQFREAIDQALG